MNELKKKPEERLAELLEMAKQENELFDDHGPAILGDRLQKPIFQEKEE